MDGPSGAGKTTLATRLAERLRRPDGTGVTVIRMDDLYPGWDGLAAAAPLLAEDVLAPLARGEDGRYRRFDWQAMAYAEPHDVPTSTPWLVLEGAGSGGAATRPWLSALAWLDAGPQTRRRRALERDGDAYRPHWERWARQEAAWFAEQGTRLHADVVVDTGD
ncbi:hypothetical protein [Arsenicicoccus sp. oral taxon 190]|uniref:hypothetical protein n=1 Tax=Arsenicicoccus sp. oral taxon 190 TaxID=1658671 RepID=UPI000AE4FE99|nr:hypothetical protein [Arsenicicoccus sp. oral taxon 190]